MIFLISFILLSVSFVVFYEFNKDKERHQRYKKDMEISKIFMHQYKSGNITPELIEYMNSLDFSVINDSKKIKDILDSKDIKSRDIRSNRFFKIRHLRSKEGSYVYIRTPLDEMILMNNAPVSGGINIIFGIYIAIVSIFIILYLSIINKLKPLKVLKQSVKNFGNEKFDVEYLSSNEDEISELANEFHHAAAKLKRIKESRNVFIRNIMHELKTPITKGKFLVQLERTDENVQSMQKVFYRLESLINEFASIEELISSRKELDIKEYFLEDIVDNAIDILMCGEEEVVKEFDNIKIKVDFNLFSIAVKNLLDNGIKYSQDKRVHVKMQGGKLVFENSATALSHPLKSYFEPFFRGDDVKTDQSFGLGLYIVKHILDAHSFSLKYEHVEGINRFIIKLRD